MTMPIANQVADAITTVKGRIYAKAGNLFWRKPSNGAIVPLSGGGGAFTVVPTASGASNIAPGTIALGTDNGEFTFTLSAGVNDGDQCGFVVIGSDGNSVITDGGNVGGNPPNIETGYQYRAAIYTWSATTSLWYMTSVVTRQAA